MDNMHGQIQTCLRLEVRRLHSKPTRPHPSRLGPRCLRGVLVKLARYETTSTFNLFQYIITDGAHTMNECSIQYRLRRFQLGSFPSISPKNQDLIYRGEPPGSVAFRSKSGVRVYVNVDVGQDQVKRTAAKGSQPWPPCSLETRRGTRSGRR